MPPELAAFWVAAGGLLTGAGAVLGYLAKRGMSNGKGNPGGEAKFNDMLLELRTISVGIQNLNQALGKAITNNEDAHRRIEGRQYGKSGE